MVERYGGPEEINRKAAEAVKLENLMARLEKAKSPYVKDLTWLIEQRDGKAFISMADYLRKVKGAPAALNQKNAVTLEISALQYFPWLIAEAGTASKKANSCRAGSSGCARWSSRRPTTETSWRSRRPCRSSAPATSRPWTPRGPTAPTSTWAGPRPSPATSAASASPTSYPLKWADEFLKYYTTYGIRQVLNINPGTVLVGYLMHRLGIDNEFKISVFMGNDNPFAILWTLLAARLFSREDGRTSLIGFNLSNSANNETLRQASYLRKALGLEEVVRFEHHITETWKSIVRQPYNRRAELVEIAKEVPNISAKHEGGEPEIEQTLSHPSDILDYFLAKTDAENAGLMPALEKNYMEKHRSVELTAQALVKAGIGVVCAPKLHR